MKIQDVTLTLFSWDDIPSTSYGAHTGRFAGGSKLGLLAITTDQGITGHSFLGSAFFPADMDGASLIRYLKPILLQQVLDSLVKRPWGWIAKLCEGMRSWKA